MTIWLSEEEVRALLAPDELISKMESALAAFSRGEVEQPLRTVLQPGRGSWFASMPMASSSLGAVGAKLVTVYPRNAARNLPTHLATVVLVDPDTGMLNAVMDGRYITEARTAAVSAVSLKYLAAGDARTLAIIGSGVQARSHLRVLPWSGASRPSGAGARGRKAGTNWPPNFSVWPRATRPKGLRAMPT